MDKILDSQILQKITEVREIIEHLETPNPTLKNQFDTLVNLITSYMSQSNDILIDKDISDYVPVTLSGAVTYYMLMISDKKYHWRTQEAKFRTLAENDVNNEEIMKTVSKCYQILFDLVDLYNQFTKIHNDLGADVDHDIKNHIASLNIDANRIIMEIKSVMSNHMADYINSHDIEQVGSK